MGSVVTQNCELLLIFFESRLFIPCLKSNFKCFRRNILFYWKFNYFWKSNVVVYNGSLKQYGGNFRLPQIRLKSIKLVLSHLCLHTLAVLRNLCHFVLIYSLLYLVIKKKLWTLAFFLLFSLPCSLFQTSKFHQNLFMHLTLSAVCSHSALVCWPSARYFTVSSKLRAHITQSF